MIEHSKAIVSAILFQKQKGEVKVFLQTRWKPKVSPMYSGMIEIPAGVIDLYENVYDALRREVKEETNLDIVRIVDDYRGDIVQPRAGDRAFVFKPFVCQQALETNNGLPWIGFVFLCEVQGEVKIDMSEAKNPQWASLDELTELVKNRAETIFPLQLPVMHYFIENIKAISL